MMVRLELSINLDEVAGGENLRVVVFNLATWAERTGRIQALIDGAASQQPGNPAVKRLVEAALTWDAPATDGEARPDDTPAVALPIVGDGPVLVIVGSVPLRFDWVTISAGKFLMGSDKRNDRHARDDETPQQHIALPTYRIARVPVTIAQFALFVGESGYQTVAEKAGRAFVFSGAKWEWEDGANWRHPHGAASDVQQKLEHPVTCVSWRDAVAFCHWASEMTGITIRLPSESEWEKAARGVDGRIWPWGNNAPTIDHCNLNMNVGDTTPVGDYPNGASPYGVLDMAGNVWEWTSTRWADNCRSYKPDDWVEGDDSRTLRGGSLFNLPEWVRCTSRIKVVTPTSIDLGFRIVSSGS